MPQATLKAIKAMQYLRNLIKERFSIQTRRKLRNFVDDLKSTMHGSNLVKLGMIYRTDKQGTHNYCPIYKDHFSEFRNKKIKLLEIGVGGYSNPNHGGQSLRMWKRFFTKGQIFSIDYYDKSPLQEKRIQIFKGSQIDFNFLEEVSNATGPYDIIIDDGSHVNSHVIETFRFLFKQLKDGGIYVIEDIQTSYWKDFGGDSENRDNLNTTMGFFKRLTDSLNHKDFMQPGYQPTYFDRNITSIHFYRNVILIHKGKNERESSLVVNNEYRIR